MIMCKIIYCFFVNYILQNITKVGSGHMNEDQNGNVPSLTPTHFSSLTKDFISALTFGAASVTVACYTQLNLFNLFRIQSERD